MNENAECRMQNTEWTKTFYVLHSTFYILKEL